MNENIRLMVSVPKIRVGNPLISWEQTLAFLEEQSHQGTDLTLLPSFAFTSPSSKDLLTNPSLLYQLEQTLQQLRRWSHNQTGYFVLGTVKLHQGIPLSTAVVIHGGLIVAEIPLSDKRLPTLPFPPEESHPTDSTFLIGDVRVQICTQDFSQLVYGATEAAQNGCDLLLIPSYAPLVAGEIKETCRLIKELSASLGLAIALVNGGLGDTSSPELYHGFYAVYERGELLAFETGHNQSIGTTVDIDSDILKSGRSPSFTRPLSSPLYEISPEKKLDLFRKIPKNPFLPTDQEEKEGYLEELFFYQTRSLATRMENTGLHQLIIGVSGGIDSTVALLVCVAACDYLDLPLSSVHGITLPGLGTSDHTYFNALALLEQLGISRQDISIRPSILQHFEDIGHNGDPDVAYENAQARERTQILLDLANMMSGLVVGTGDLSEEALGFSTFGGDHLASYNVNICMTKTMLRELIAYFIKVNRFPQITPILQEILDTPISPELLPPSPDGEILQKTEDLLGPYELHEFFLYYLTVYHMAPSKIYQYACRVFEDQMNQEFIYDKLVFFIKKFCGNQFKRSCAPDAAAITRCNLLPHCYTIASDLDPSGLLTDLETYNPMKERM